LKCAAPGVTARPLAAAAAPFILPPLPYSYDALEPYIDAQTTQIHSDKHQQKKPSGKLAAAITQTFGEQDKLEDGLTKASVGCFRRRLGLALAR
jgi:superoxide dismutase